MSSIDERRYTCDRCGGTAVVQVDPKDSLNMPPGWEIIDGPKGSMPELCGTCVRAFWQDFMHCAPFFPGEKPKRTCYMNLDHDEVRTVADVRREVLEKVVDIVDRTSNRDTLPYTFRALIEEFDISDLPSKVKQDAAPS